MDALRTADLGVTLKSLFCQYEKDRVSWEQRMLQNYRQYRGEYDPDVQAELDKNRSKAYPKVTRVKCISVVARLMQMLFPASEKNWGIEPSPVPNMSEAHLRAALAAVPEGTADEMIEAAIKKYAAARAKKMELEMDDQLVELGGTKELPYVSLCKKIIEHGTKYGMGILKGPLVREQEQTRWARNILTGQIEVSSTKVYRPYYEVCSPWNYYPDLSAKTFCAMDGQFERHPMSRRQLLELAKLPGYDEDQIKAFIAAHRDGNFRWRSFETELRTMGTQERNLESRGKFEAVSYWGEAKVGQLREAMGPEALVAPDLDDDEMGEVQVWLLDQHVIKAEINAYQPHMRPYHHFVFEEDDSSLAGEGLPHVLRDSALGVAAATRMMVDNAAVSAGPQFEVNRALLAPDADAQTIHAFKVWERDETGPEAQYPAVREIRVSSHVPDLMNVLALFKGFADDESFVSPALSGDFQNIAKEPFRTAQGGSMLLSGAMLPFRDVVRNFDAFTLSVMTSLTQWNMQFNDKEEIKGDYQITPRGSSSLLAKEIRAASLDQFSMTLRPEEAIHVNFRDVVVERAKVRDLPVDRIIVSEEEVERRQKEQAARSERDAQLQREVIEAQIKETVAAAVQKLSQAKKAGAAADKLIAEVVQDAFGSGAAD